jgi:hypothetical protein
VEETEFPRNTGLLKEPLLLIIDWYGPHFTLAQIKKYDKRNIFIELVPPNMIRVMQPLDVAVKKVFRTRLERVMTVMLWKPSTN